MLDGCKGVRAPLTPCGVEMSISSGLGQIAGLQNH